MVSVDIHWWAIIGAAVVNMVLGAIWYAPMLFGSAWMAEMGKKGQMKMQPGNMLAMFIIALGIGYVLSHFVAYAGANTFKLGVEAGVWASLGFFALPMASGTFAGGSSWKLWAIVSGYWVVSLSLMGGILAMVR